MTTYDVTFQVSNQYSGIYPTFSNEYGTKMAVVSVKAKNTKEAWTKAQLESGLAVVCKVKESV